MNLNDFHFIRPLWLLLLVPLVWLLWALWKYRGNHGAWNSVVEAHLQPHVLMGQTRLRQRWPMAVIAVAGVLGILALAGPTWQRLPQPVFRDLSALVILLDLSRSMDAKDISPSRLARARFKIKDLLDRRKAGQTALIVYAEDAYVVSPLTDDTATIASQLTALTTDLVPVQGGDARIAMQQALRLLKQTGVNRGQVLLLTDEIRLARDADQAKALRRQGHRLSILGIGTERGAPIPLRDGGFVKDGNGAIVIPTLQEDHMTDLARIGGGIFQRIRVDDGDLDALLRHIDKQRMENKGEATRQVTERWQEQGPWLLLLVVPLAALAFRRGYLLLALFFLLPYGSTAQALEWSDLWSRPDQRGMRAFEQGDNTKAAEQFTDRRWQAAARYRNGDYQAAIDALQDLDDTEALYNKGNALARLGRTQEAIGAYEQALERNPEHEDARHNRDLLNQEEQESSQQDAKPKDAPPKDDPEPPKSDPPSDDKGDQSASPENQKSDEVSQGQDPQQAAEDAAQTSDKSATGADVNPEPQASDHQQQPPPRETQRQRPNEHQDGNSDQDAATQHVDSAEPRQKDPQAQAQAREQWLRRIPDDPGGLLRRKFYYQYQQRDRKQSKNEQAW